MSDICDHTSVGILVWQKGKLLLLERRKPPFGIAPPAGHVDDRETFEDAAKSELLEEVGLTATRLSLVTSGARQNPCRREGGTWHYWRVYEAEASGDIKASEDETKSADWYNLAEVEQLLQRSREYKKGKLSQEEWVARPGMEPVWVELLNEIKLVPKSSDVRVAAPSHSDIAWARGYAWRWFSYHAAQRIAVFRAYLIAIAFLFAGYSTLSTNGSYEQASGVAIALLFITFLFWRLDLRNIQLVKVGEEYLKSEEHIVAHRLRRPELEILHATENKWHPWPYSFSDIYKQLFRLVAAISILMGGWAAWKAYDAHAHPRSDVQHIQTSVTMIQPATIDIRGPDVSHKKTVQQTTQTRSTP